jgi:hypothetical protein
MSFPINTAFVVSLTPSFPGVEVEEVVGYVALLLLQLIRVFAFLLESQLVLLLDFPFHS